MLRVGYCMTPYHVLETLSFHEDAERMIIICRYADYYRPLLSDFPGLELVEIDQRRDVLDRLRKSGERFDFYFATVWNRTALLLEEAALRSGGHINLIDDGAGGFGGRGRDWRRHVRRIAYALLDGTQYCGHPSEKRYDAARTTFYSVVPELSSAPMKPKQIDLARLRGLLGRVEPHFEHLRPYHGFPVFFDTNDCEAGWYPFEKKIEILRELLPNEPTIYLPHPAQRLDLVSRLPQLINLRDQTHHWNELACYFLKPKTVYSAFSTSAFTLRKIFGLSFTCKFLHEDFYQRTGHRNFILSSSMRAYFEGLC